METEPQLSGALAALSFLMSENRPKSLVLVEARELCSGATGRNAGHCKPDIWRGFTHYSSLFGPVEALRVSFTIGSVSLS